MLEFPDVSKAVDMLTATDKAVELLLERVVDGSAEDPDPNLPMARQIETAQKFYAQAIVDGAGNKTLTGIQNFIELAKNAVLKEVEEQQMAQGAATAAAQQGMDMQAPPGPLSPQAAGNMPVPPEGQQAAMPMNQGGMR